jgi:hypothetical protein
MVIFVEIGEKWPKTGKSTPVKQGQIRGPTKLESLPNPHAPTVTVDLMAQ